MISDSGLLCRIGGHYIEPMIDIIRYKIHHRWKQGKITVAAAVMFLVLIGAAVQLYQVSLAATVTVGTVATKSSPLTVRKGPGADQAKLGTVAKGTTVTILGEENGWYKIAYGNGSGYVKKDYIADVHEEEQDTEFQDKLTAQGFPADYAQQLAQLHNKYPKWQFEPVNTGLDWQTAIAEESKIGKNLVQGQNSDAQKSTAPGAYDWSRNNWYGFDGDSWVCASEAMIAYCMDPRNFLSEDGIFQFETLSYQKYQNASGTKALLNGTFMSGNYTEPDGTKKSYPETFVSVGKEVGVSPYHLAARCKQEQGTKGTSDSISGKYKGYKNYFNYFNVGAYPAGGKNSIENGLIYAKKQGWNTRYASILGGSKVVADKYVLQGQNTIYFEKFNVVNASALYSHQYMTNVQAAVSEGKNSKKAYTDLNQGFVFRIPIYANMPNTPCSLPEGGNPNNWLAELRVTNYNLTPSFQGSVQNYSFIVPEQVSSIQISAKPVASSSTVRGTGTVNLQYGNNKIEVVCKAQNGDDRVYTLQVVRQKSGTSGADPGTSGQKITYGDINGDGRISNADLVLMKKHILEISILKGDALKAADVNHNGSITNADVVLMKKHILGIAEIQ